MFSESLDTNAIGMLSLFGITLVLSTIMVISGYIGLRRTGADVAANPATVQ